MTTEDEMAIVMNDNVIPSRILHNTVQLVISNTKTGKVERLRFSTREDARKYADKYMQRKDHTKYRVEIQ